MHCVRLGYLCCSNRPNKWNSKFYFSFVCVCVFCVCAAFVEKCSSAVYLPWQCQKKIAFSPISSIFHCSLLLFLLSSRWMFFFFCLGYLMLLWVFWLNRRQEKEKEKKWKKSNGNRRSFMQFTRQPFIPLKELHRYTAFYRLLSCAWVCEKEKKIEQIHA